MNITRNSSSTLHSKEHLCKFTKGRCTSQFILIWFEIAKYIMFIMCTIGKLKVCVFMYKQESMLTEIEYTWKYTLIHYKTIILSNTSFAHILIDSRTVVVVKWKCYSVVSNSCNSMVCSPPSFSVHGTLQSTIAIPFLRGSFRPRDWTQVSCIASRFFTIWAIRKTPTCSRHEFDPWIGKILWKREQLPAPVFWLGEIQTMHGVAKSSTFT